MCYYRKEVDFADSISSADFVDIFYKKQGVVYIVNIDQLRHFCEVYDYRNILKASSQLFITQQGLSKSIRSLEREFDTALFIRTHDGVIPTTFADSIINNVRSILEEEAVIKTKLDKLLKEDEGIITVSCSNMMLQVLPRGTKVKVESTAPKAAWVYLERSETDALKDVLEEKCDFAFISNPPDETDFIVSKILQYPLVAMVPTSDPLSRKRVIYLSDLADSTIIPFSDQWNFHFSLMNYMREKKFTPTIDFEAEDPIHMFIVVNNRLGIGILPELYVNYLPAESKVKYIPFGENIPWALSVVTKRGKKHTQVIESIIEAFKEQARLMDKK